MAAPVFESGSTVGGNGHGTSVTLTKPGGVVENDILTFHLNKENTESVTYPSGWTEAAFVDSGGSRAHYAWKRATASEPASYVFSWASSPWRNASLSRISGCATSGDPNDVTPSTNAPAGSDTAVPCSSVTTVSDECLLIAMAAWLNDRTASPPSGMTEQVDHLTQSVASVAQASAGASGDKSFTLSGAEARRSGIIAALKPAGGAPPAGRPAQLNDQSALPPLGAANEFAR